jgi:hypothetical protein
MRHDPVNMKFRSTVWAEGHYSVMGGHLLRRSRQTIRPSIKEHTQMSLPTTTSSTADVTSRKAYCKPARALDKTGHW